jgi:glycerol-1-phosphate dehydrogenase [NAD(P)+]
VFVDGVKRTLPSRYPDVLVCDLETVRDAPSSMTAAGVGDLVAALSSYADWYLAYQLGLDDTHTEFARTLMGRLDDILWARAPAIRAGDLEATALLAKLITLAGLAMSLSHATAPLSGYEHVISHVLDLRAERAGRPLAQHGSQVALATLLTTRAWALFLAEFDPAEVSLARCYPDADVMEARIRDTFAELDPSGRVADECWADYKLKLEQWQAQRARTAEAFQNWPMVRPELHDRLRTWRRAAEILARAGAPLRFELLDPPAAEGEVRFAFFAAPLIRRRLTLGDLFVFLQWEAEALWPRVWPQGEPPTPSPS